MTTTLEAAASGRSDHLHVLHIGPDIHGPGGMPAVIRTLLASPLAERYGFAFLRTYGSASNAKRLWTFAFGLVQLAVWCCRPGDRLVHVHTATRGSWYRKAIAVVVVKSLRRPVVLHFHAGEGDISAFEQRLGPVRLLLLRRAFAKADAVIAVSAAGAAEVKRIFSFPAVGVVPNAAPSVVVALRRPPQPARPTIVYLGGFANAAKGSAVLLEALTDLATVAPGFDVLLAGPGKPPAAAQELLRSSHVQWAGYLSEKDKAAALREAQIFVMPSVSEGMPVALLEAMAHGLAIVATRVGGIPDTVEHRVEALLVEPHDSAALALALGELLADPDLRRNLGRGARRRAERLNASEVFGQLDGIYRTAADRLDDREAVSAPALAA